MPEPFHIFSDSFTVHCNDQVTSILFQFNALASEEGERTRLGTVTLTNSAAKILIYLAWQQVMQAEEDEGTSFEVSPEILEAAGWSRDYWDAFWTPMED